MSLLLMSTAYSNFVAVTVFLCFAWNVHMLYCDKWNEKVWLSTMLASKHKNNRCNYKERSNVKIVKHNNYIAAWFPGLYYLFNGPDIVLQNYVWHQLASFSRDDTNSRKSSGVPIAVKTPETYYIHFSSDHVQELKDASDEHLSLHALSNDVMLPNDLRTFEGEKNENHGKGQSRTNAWNRCFTLTN